MFKLLGYLIRVVMIFLYQGIVNVKCKTHFSANIRLGTRQHFEFIVILKDDTINDNLVTTGRTPNRVSVLFIVRL